MSYPHNYHQLVTKPNHSLTDVQSTVTNDSQEESKCPQAEPELEESTDDSMMQDVSPDDRDKVEEFESSIGAECATSCSANHLGNMEQSTPQGPLNQAQHRITEHLLSTGCYHKAPDWASKMPTWTDLPQVLTPAMPKKRMLDWMTNLRRKSHVWKAKFKGFPLPDASLVPPHLPRPPD